MLCRCRFGVLIVCGFLAAVGLGVVLDLLEHREELLEVFDLLEVDRNEQLLNDDLLAGATLAGASALGAFLLAASACEVDLLDGLAFERSLRAVEPLLNPVVIGMTALTCGYCGTLMTPMAANFNIVPVAILNMKDRWGVIKNQVLVGLIMLVFQICYMIVLK